MSRCKYSTYCGGCEHIDEDISYQLQEKNGIVTTVFKDYKNANIEPIVSSYYPLKYRNKIHLAFTELKGRTLIGFYEEGSTKVTDINDCLLFDSWAKKLISILREYISRFKIRPYVKGNGILRYAHARCVDNKIQLTLVVVSDNFPGRDWLYNELAKYFSEVSFYLNINHRTDHAIFDKYFKFVKGNKYLNFEMNGVKVALTPSSFLQVNLPIASKMYKRAIEKLDICKDTIVLDLYSGIGITSIMFARVAREVYSIEEVESATQNEKYMCKLNNVNNVRILSGKCEDMIEQLVTSIDPSSDVVVFLDPARNGVNKRVIDALSGLNVRKIVYMSCNINTCVNDINHIVNGNNMVVTDILPYNMFPYTKHIEALVCIDENNRG